jgi:hypothetical protein
LAEDTLILHLDIATKAIRLCSICNSPVKINVELKEFYHAEPLANIKSAIFNFKEIPGKQSSWIPRDLPNAKAIAPSEKKSPTI